MLYRGIRCLFLQIRDRLRKLVWFEKKKQQVSLFPSLAQCALSMLSETLLQTPVCFCFLRIAHPSACRMPLSLFLSLSLPPPSPLHSSHRTLARQHQGEMRVKRRALMNTWYSGLLQSRGVRFDPFPLPVPWIGQHPAPRPGSPAGLSDCFSRSDSKISRLAQRLNQRQSDAALIKDFRPLFLLTSGSSQSLDRWVSFSVSFTQSVLFLHGAGGIGGGAFPSSVAKITHHPTSVSHRCSSVTVAAALSLLIGLIGSEA